jgi:hypothetical protein
LSLVQPGNAVRHARLRAQAHHCAAIAFKFSKWVIYLASHSPSRAWHSVRVDGLPVAFGEAIAQIAEYERPRVGRASPMERRDERELRDELVSLRAEHRQLDLEIVALENSATADQLLVKRLKKKKLVLKDRITQIEDRLLPDIIA